MNKDKLVIVEIMRGPVPTLCENGKASIDYGLNYHQRKEAADTIEALYEGLAANVRELRVMLPLIHHASTRNDIAAVVEQGEEAIALARGEQQP